MAHSVVLTWTESSDAVDGYNIYRSSTAGTEVAPALNGTTPITVDTFTDNTVTDGEWFYVAKSVKGGVESVPSNEVAVKILPAAPTGLAATGS